MIKNCPYKLFQADAQDKDLLSPESVDLIVTSPPYNLGKPYSGKVHDDSVTFAEYLQFTYSWLKNCHLWLKPTGRICVNIALDTGKGLKQPLMAYLTYIAVGIGFRYRTTIIWNEGNISRRTAWGSYQSASAPNIITPVEAIVVLYKGNAWKRERQGETDINAEDFKKWVLGMWSFPGASAKTCWP